MGGAKAKPEDSKGGTKSSKKRKTFWDSYSSFALILGAILFLRFFVVEPFKIPTGSMEPVLIGHEDFGDRIAANLLAYAGGRDPERFDIVVFKYHDQWSGGGGTGSKNYIKRVVGLPGETILLSGGDLFRKEDGEFRILRKWEAVPKFQERCWQPVALCNFQMKETPEALPPDERSAAELLAGQENRFRFPWKTSCPDGQGRTQPARLAGGGWGLEVEGAVELEYAHQVRDVYIKRGRWPFKHLGCPSARTGNEDGSGERSELIRPYIPNSWSGVRCPNCGQRRFPLSNDPEVEPRIVPAREYRVRFEVESATPAGGEGLTALNVKMLEGAILKGEKLASSPRGPFSAEVLDVRRRTAEVEVEALDLAAGERGVLVIRSTAPVQPGTYQYRAQRPTKELFIYGGYETVGDLKVRVELEALEPGGGLLLEVGSQAHSGVWSVSLGGAAPAAPAGPGRHSAGEALTLAAPGRHTLSLAYVDGTVMAEADGRELEPVKVSVAPLKTAARKNPNFARLRFAGAKVRLHRLDLFRDLHYALLLDEWRGHALAAGDWGDRDEKEYLGRQDWCEEHISNRWKEFSQRPYRGNLEYFQCEVPEKHFLVLGDNSPGSLDGRKWAFVPRTEIKGRGELIWWPPTRWRRLH